MRRALVSVLVILFLAAPATAHKRDLIRAGKRVGPIKLYETTVKEAKRWFGDPTRRRIVGRGCVQNVLELRWDGSLKVWAGRYENGRAPIAEAHVFAPTLTSTQHGALAIHTRRYIRVGDSERKVRRKYPNARAETHLGHTHYIVEDEYDRLYVRVEDGVAVKLEARPFEWC